MAQVIVEKRDIFQYLKRTSQLLDRLNPVTRWLHFIGMGICFLWVCFIFLDVLLRYVFLKPFAGGMDISQIAMVIVVFLAVPYVQFRKKHIALDLITSRLSPTAALITNITYSIITMIVLGIIIWQGIVNVMSFINGDVTSSVYEIPLAIPAAVIPFGGTLFFFMVLRDFLNKLVEAGERRLRSAWVLMIGIPILLLILTVLWIQGVIPTPTPPIVGVISVVVFLVFILLGLPIGITLAMTGIIFMMKLVGVGPGLSTAGVTLFWHASDYNWTVIILFILMGFFVVHSRLGEDTFYAAYKWLGHFPGGLAQATIGASTALAAIVGDVAASTVTLGTVALPEMKKYNYDRGLAVGVICAGATLGPMIPPSIGFIIFGMLAEESIGKLFIAGIIPGLLLAVSFFVITYIKCKRNPKLGPPGERSSWRDRFVSLKSSGPILLLFLIVIGGIYAGIFSAIEGGGIGAFITFVIAMAMRRLTWKKFWAALSDSGVTIGMLLFMIVCTLVYAHVLAASNLTTMLATIIQGLYVSNMVIVAAMAIMFLLLGFIMDAGVVLVFTLPILAPIAQALNIDMIWLGVLLVLTVNLGMITPPYAIVIFMLRGLAPDIPSPVLYRGVIPFVWSSLVVAALIFFIPPIATWLPNILK
jgi:tripartite ATP-independent transporter DctM subunit